MSAIHSRDTLPEVVVRKMLWANGYRFRVCDKRTLKHEFYGRQDRARNLYVQVPLYVGQYLFSTAGIGYWLAGFHVNCAFKGDTRQTLNATTKALYEPFLGVWHEMDNHGYRYNVPLERTGERLRLQFDVLAHVEAGYEYTTFYNGRIYRTAPGKPRLPTSLCRIRGLWYAQYMSSY